MAALDYQRQIAFDADIRAHDHRYAAMPFDPAEAIPYRDGFSGKLSDDELEVLVGPSLKGSGQAEASDKDADVSQAGAEALAKLRRYGPYATELEGEGGTGDEQDGKNAPAAWHLNPPWDWRSAHGFTKCAVLSPLRHAFAVHVGQRPRQAPLRADRPPRTFRHL
ncbi:hypothetical protein [Mesorhizobium sp.]|uniref:hypothetical protein n=1 Tax=Mesorhizobium sp. TaxID=1871066 RepID=UPI0025E011FC|nr:hypothetical protein [Mesorhizobium sp.]